MRLSLDRFRTCWTYVGLWLVLGGVLGHFTACGYTVVGSMPQGTVRQVLVSVVPFRNETRESELESHVTAAMRRAIMHSPVLDLAAQGTALRHLHGVVRRFRTIPVAFDANDNALQYRIEADILIRLIAKPSQETMLEREFSAWAEYLVSNTGTIRENVVAREAALVRLAQQFASTCTAFLVATLL